MQSASPASQRAINDRTLTQTGALILPSRYYNAEGDDRKKHQQTTDEAVDKVSLEGNKPTSTTSQAVSQSSNQSANERNNRTRDRTTNRAPVKRPIMPTSGTKSQLNTHTNTHVTTAKQATKASEGKNKTK